MVLVADDEPDVVTYLRALLEDNGYEVVTAHDGEECLREARRRRPDLITLDVTMPGKSGLQVFRELRAPGSAVPHVPVCFVSGSAAERHLQYQPDLGAPEGYLSKPVDEGRLLEMVERILAATRSRAS